MNNEILKPNQYRRAIHLKPQKLASPGNACPHCLKREPFIIIVIGEVGSAFVFRWIVVCDLVVKEGQ